MEKSVLAKAEKALVKVKAKTARGHRVLKKRQPQVVEDVKVACFIRGTTTSPVVNAVLSDLTALKKPDAVVCQRRNPVHPLDPGSVATVEFLMQKNGPAGLACIGTHSKKRPHCLTFCRAFDDRLLDAVELMVVKYEAMAESSRLGSLVGSKPAFVVVGEQFEIDPKLRLVKNMLIDFYHGRQVDTVDLLGLETCISLVHLEGDRIGLRVYKINLKASGSATPTVHLDKMGPFVDFKVGRVQEPSEELLKQALRIPKEVTGGTKVKNVSHTALGHKMGRVHVGKQDIETIQTRKVKALKPPKVAKPEGAKTDKKMKKKHEK